MIVELDVGNSRCKWRVLAADGSTRLDGACPVVDLGRELEGLAARGAIVRVRTACVRGQAIEQEVGEMVRAACGIEPEFARTTAEAAGVRCAYRDPSRLGVDRWLAMLAGFAATGGAVCVVDCGSAITADLVDDGGQHRGGFIVPGVAMMRASLLNATDRVRFEGDGSDADLSPGTDTAQAVTHGTLLAAVGLLHAVHERFGRLCPAVPVLLTGGDAPAVMPWLDFPVKLQPHLVLDGLRLALP